MHQEYRAEVFDDDDAEVADLPKQPKFGAGGVLLLGRAGEQPRECYSCGLHHVRPTRGRIEDLGFCR